MELIKEETPADRLCRKVANAVISTFEENWEAAVDSIEIKLTHREQTDESESGWVYSVNWKDK